MSNTPTSLHAAASDLRKFVKTFESVFELKSVIDAAISAEATAKDYASRIDASKTALFNAEAAYATREKAIAVRLAQSGNNADAAEKAAAAAHAATTAKNAEAVKKAEATLAAVNLAAAEAARQYDAAIVHNQTKLLASEANIKIAEKKLADINAAIAAIASR